MLASLPRHGNFTSASTLEALLIPLLSPSYCHDHLCRSTINHYSNFASLIASRPPCYIPFARSSTMCLSVCITYACGHVANWHDYISPGGAHKWPVWTSRKSSNIVPRKDNNPCIGDRPCCCSSICCEEKVKDIWREDRSEKAKHKSKKSNNGYRNSKEIREALLALPKWSGNG